MKSIVLAVVFNSALVFVVGLTEQEEIHQKVEKREEEAAKQCNTIYPVTEDTRIKLENYVISGTTIPKDFHTSEWCNLYCNLEKLGFFDAEGKMPLEKIYKSLLQKLPQFKPNRHTLLFHLLQTYRGTKDMEDECEKAYVAYYRFTEAVMLATVAADLDTNIDSRTRTKVIDQLLTGTDLPKELQPSMEKSLQNTELFFDIAILK